MLLLMLEGLIGQKAAQRTLTVDTPCRQGSVHQQQCDECNKSSADDVGHSYVFTGNGSLREEAV